MKNTRFNHASNRALGYTLIEFLVTLSVVGILIGIVAPSFRSFIQNSRLVSPANDLFHAMQFARTEAVKQQQNVVICASNNPDDQSATCSYGQFTAGWIVFADLNKNWQRDVNEPILKTHLPVNSSITVKTNNDGIVAYRNDGFLSPPGGSGKTATQNIAVYDSRGNAPIATGSTVSVARAITLDTGTGRAWESKLVADVYAACGC